jgi:DNA-binding YbaB/EbfC family protein
MPDFDLNAIMQQAQQMQAHMQQLQQSLEAVTVEGTAGAGMVKVVATGGQRIVRIEVSPEVLGEERDLLQDLLVAAVNNALDKARELAQSRVGALLPPGLAGQIPGL